MIDQLKRYVAVIVGLLLAGIAAVERSGEPPALAGTDHALPVIREQYLETIDPGREVLEFPESFRVLLPTKLPEPAEAPDGLLDPALAAALPEEPPDPGFVLQLQSVVAFADGSGQAVINNATVTVGSPILGTGREEPPVLAALHGTSALIMFEGQPLLMDVDRIPQLTVGADAVDEEGGPLELLLGQRP